MGNDPSLERLPPDSWFCRRVEYQITRSERKLD